MRIPILAPVRYDPVFSNIELLTVHIGLASVDLAPGPVNDRMVLGDGRFVPLSI